MSLSASQTDESFLRAIHFVQMLFESTVRSSRRGKNRSALPGVRQESAPPGSVQFFRIDAVKPQGVFPTDPLNFFRRDPLDLRNSTDHVRE